MTAYLTCPVCNGSKSVPIPANEQKYSWNVGKETKDCGNCGGQYQWSSPSGKVKVNVQGEPCTHAYRSSDVGRCRTAYTCIHCTDRYEIDSGD